MTQSRKPNPKRVRCAFKGLFLLFAGLGLILTFSLGNMIIGGLGIWTGMEFCKECSKYDRYI